MRPASSLPAPRLPFLAVALFAVVLLSAASAALVPGASAAAGPEVRTDNHGFRAVAPAAAGAVSDPADGSGPADMTDGADGAAGGTHAPRTDLPLSAWQALGPFGGDIEDAAVSPANPSIVLAGLAPSSGAAGKLFRSTDGGDTWSGVASVGQSVYDIAFTPSGTVYVGTADGIYKSTNNGSSWVQLSLGIGQNDVALDVTVDPSNSNTVWAGISDAMGAQTQTVLRSTNGGTTWVNMTPPMTPLGCRSIAIHPTNSNKIYCAFGGDFGNGACWVSTNGGTSWVNRSAGLPPNPMFDVVHDGTRLLLCGGMLFGSQYVGLYSSSNDGASWTALSNSFPSLYLTDIDVDPLNVQHILVASDGQGVFASTNGGSTWSFGIGGTGTFAMNSVRFAPGSSTRIFLGVSSLAVYRSLDGGASFQPSSIGIGALDVYSVAVNPANAQELAIAFQGSNDGGVYASADGGVSWQLQSAPTTRYSAVKFNDAGVLYAISSGPSSVAPEGLYRRNPDLTWTGLGPDQGGLFESDLDCMEFSHTNPALLLAGGADFGVAGWEATAWISTNAGVSWTKAYEGPESNEKVYDLWLVEDGTDQTVVGAFSDFAQVTGGAIRSTDGGFTWAQSSTGLPAAAQGAALSAFPGTPQTLYYADQYTATGAGGVYVSTNAGASWAATGYVGHGAVQGLICDPQTPGTFYILKPAPDRVMISVDGSATYSAFNTGLANAGYGRSIAFGASEPPHLYFAGTTGTYGTYVLWPAAAPELPYGLTDASGSLRAFPNPASGEVRVDLRAPSASGTVVIFSADGRRIRSLPLRQGAASWDLRDEDGREVGAGIYLLRAATLDKSGEVRGRVQIVR